MLLTIQQRFHNSKKNVKSHVWVPTGARLPVHSPALSQNYMDTLPEVSYWAIRSVSLVDCVLCFIGLHNKSRVHLLNRTYFKFTETHSSLQTCRWSMWTLHTRKALSALSFRWGPPRQRGAFGARQWFHPGSPLALLFSMTHNCDQAVYSFWVFPPTSPIFF